MNTPTLESERLILRRFTEADIDAICEIFGDVELNRFLPWYPPKSLDEAAEFYQKRYAASYSQPHGYRYAITRKCDDRPIGYVNLDVGESHDLGYGLKREYQRQGYVSEACRALIARARADGMQFVTATHDVNNLASGYVMRAVGMKYMYSYEELWQPKNFKVIFRMYQLNLDGNKSRIYRKYWEMYPNHFIETIS